ncbi:hypothetical protein ACFE04_017354 [Oxalis oulophora]
MGVGGKFWEMLKPYGKPEGPDFLRDKRVAVDLSYWIVQHETAIKAYTRNPHLRLTFFRTLNLFSKFGAYPVFVADGTPSPLKSQARIVRFLRFSGIDVSDLPVVEEGVSVERNRAFKKCVRQCIELLELLGMPVLKAEGEAEALCAQLNKEGYVDACITSDSDAFLFGAKCVIKSIKPNSKEPFECYHMSDIEAGLGLKREHLIAIALLVGNDHDLNGVQGIGLEKAVRFVQNFSENEILNRLHEIGNRETALFQSVISIVDPLANSVESSFSMVDPLANSIESSQKSKSSHCSLCGHPGSKKIHLRVPCEYCGTSYTEGCTKKPEGFKCLCSSCDKNRKDKEKKKDETWQLKVCNMIADKPDFPNEEIIDMYLCKNYGRFIETNVPLLSWRNPNTEMLVDFLSFNLPWQPSYIRKMMLPMLSTLYLRETASKLAKDILYGQYEFDSIKRIKIRFGHQLYVVKWKKFTARENIPLVLLDEESIDQQKDIIEINDSDDEIDLDEPDAPQIYVDDSNGFFLTDENMELVLRAFPEAVDRYLQEKELKDSKKRKTSNLRSQGPNEKSDLPKPKAVQPSITEFFRSTKAVNHTKPGENVATSSGEQKRIRATSNYPKSTSTYVNICS